MNGSDRRGLTVAAVILAAVAVSLAVALLIQRSTAAGLSSRISEQRAELADLNRRLGECAARQRDYRQQCLKLGGRLSTCTWSDQMPYMVDQLAGIVDPRGLKIETLQPQPMTSAKRILRFPLSLGLQTDLATLTSMLEDIENTVPLLSIERLDIRDGQDNSGRLQIDMTVSSFVVLDPNSPVKKRRKAAGPAGDRAATTTDAEGGRT